MSHACRSSSTFQARLPGYWQTRGLYNELGLLTVVLSCCSWGENCQGSFELEAPTILGQFWWQLWGADPQEANAITLSTFDLAVEGSIISGLLNLITDPSWSDDL